MLRQKFFGRGQVFLRVEEHPAGHRGERARIDRLWLWLVLGFDLHGATTSIFHARPMSASGLAVAPSPCICRATARGSADRLWKHMCSLETASHRIQHVAIGQIDAAIGQLRRGQTPYLPTTIDSRKRFAGGFCAIRQRNAARGQAQAERRSAAGSDRPAVTAEARAIKAGGERDVVVATQPQTTTDGCEVHIEDADDLAVDN